MNRDVASGTLLIAASITMLLLMGLHPTAPDILSAPGRTEAGLAMAVHAVAIASQPVLLLGLLGVSRRLGSGNLATAALVIFGFGSVAVMSAAVTSGFVAVPVIEQMVAGDDSRRAILEALLWYTGRINHGFAGVQVVASSMAILLWSGVIMRTARMPRAAGIVGLVAGGGVLLLFLSGRLGLDVHGFGLITLMHAAWFVLTGVLLLRA